MPRDPLSYRKEDEPLWQGHPVDYRYELHVLSKVRDDERARLERIEGKIAVVIAGAFAALGFSLDKAGWVWGTVAAALYLVPIGFLLSALAPVKYKDVPEPKEFYEKFPYYPVTSLEAACGAIVKAHAINHPKIEKKAEKLGTGIRGLIAVTFIVIAVKIIAGIIGSDKNQDGGQRPTATPSAVATASATTRPTAVPTTSVTAHAGKHDVGRGKGRRGVKAPH